MTTQLNDRERAIIVIQYLYKLPAPQITDGRYLADRFARLLEFYHRAFFPTMPKKDLLDLCVEVNQGIQVCMQTLNKAVEGDPKHGGFGIDKPVDIHDINLNNSQPEFTNLTESYDKAKKDFIKRKEDEDEQNSRR